MSHVRPVATAIALGFALSSSAQAQETGHRASLVGEGVRVRSGASRSAAGIC
jgi:hypothetical protein